MPSMLLPWHNYLNGQGVLGCLPHVHFAVHSAYDAARYIRMTITGMLTNIESDFECSGPCLHLGHVTLLSESLDLKWCLGI